MIVIYNTLGVYGGSHTLMLRMGEWLNSHNEKMTIICTEASNTEIISKLEKNNVKIIEANLADAKLGYKIFKELLAEPIKVFCFTWDCYLDVERVKKKYNLLFDNFVYCIHPETFKKGVSLKSKFMRKCVINSYRKIFKHMNDNNAIFSMNETDVELSEKFLNCNLHNTIPIIRLPMLCIERADSEDIVRYGFNSNVVLTAARAEFPFKGYLIGLVDVFAKLKAIYPEMRLEYVASGDDMQELRNKVQRQKEAIKSAITIHGWMEYEDLKKKIRECKVFIGMGTSVLDAALQYKPSIAVKFNTLDCISDHFVAENPIALSSFSQESAEYKIKEAFDWDFTEYREQCFLSFARTKEVYDIDVCMRKMINMENKQKSSILSNYECARHHLNLLYSKIRFRNKKSFSDFKNIEWDKG